MKIRIWTGKEYRYPPSLGEWDFNDCKLFAGYNNKTAIRELYIGENDKAGNEICEGDKLLTDEAGWIAPVVYCAASFMLITEGGGFSASPDWAKCKIIGTIHDRP